MPELLIAVDWRAWLIFVPIVVFAAVVYASIGFGAGIVAVPLATQFFDLHFTIAVLAILEVVNSTRLVVNQRGQVVVNEARNLIIAAIGGTALGMMLLIALPVSWLMLGLAGFITVFLLHTTFFKGSRKQAAPFWAWPTGFIAGTCSAMFGAGGPPYAIYLRMRQLDIARFRATMGMVGMFNLIARVIGFIIIGFYAKPPALATALALLPISVATTLITERVRDRIPATLLMNTTSVILALAAVSLIWRSGHMPPGG